jgi:hypothetical protein
MSASNGVREKVVIPALVCGSAGSDLCGEQKGNSGVCVLPSRTLLSKTGLEDCAVFISSVGTVYPDSQDGHASCKLAPGRLVPMVEPDVNGEVILLGSVRG